MNLREWAARLMIAIVLTWNLQAAGALIAYPDRFMAGFELSGVPGAAAVRGVGILFLMWQVPYVVAMIFPVRHSTSLVEAVVMQGIGFLGEVALWLFLPESHFVLRQSIWRYIFFDGLGFGLLSAALMLVFKMKMRENKNEEACG